MCITRPSSRRRDQRCTGWAARSATRSGVPPLALSDWESGVTALTRLTDERPRLVVLDELPYLTRQAPELASALQLAVDDGRQDGGPPVRLAVCGSALSVMGGLLAGQRPLRGRAELVLSLRPFGFRDAASFWGVAHDPRLAVQLAGVMGGTPGYRDLVRAAPHSVGELDEWLTGTVLDPSSALFREDEYLLAEEPGIADRALYQSVLTAVAGGATSETAVAAQLGRDRVAVQHPLRVLKEAGFVVAEEDALRQRRPVLRLADPLVRFLHVVVRPDRAAYEDRRASETFAAATDRFRAQVMGPRFEELAREWTARHAAAETTGGDVGRVAPAVVDDPEHRSRHQLDVVALARGSGVRRRPEVRLLGEATYTAQPVGTGELVRLERIRTALGARGRADVTTARLALFSAAGFQEDLVGAAAARTDLELVDLERLYGGS